MKIQSRFFSVFVNRLSLLFVTLLISACATSFPFNTSRVVPAAEGTVKYKEDKNNNYTVQLKVMRLADANRLTPARKLYVLWMDTDRDGIRNLGQLKTVEGFFTSALNTSFSTSTPFKPTRFFITAENDMLVRTPSNYIVLDTKD